MKISIDTRTIESGDVFIPVKGKNYDGHDYMEEAVRKGATVLDVDLADYARKYRKKLKASVIAVTGSAGKTTIKDLIYTVLKRKFNVIKTLENKNNEVGVPLTILSADYNTDIIIIEMGMRNKGDIDYLTKIVRPTHVIITCIGKSHIERLKTEKNIAYAKSEVFARPLAWENKDRYAIINYSTPYYQLLYNKAVKKGYRVLPYDGEDKIDQNINLCYLTGKHFGLKEEEIKESLAEYQSSSHRLKRVIIKDITVVDDTYNANPDGVIYALQYLRRLEGRKIFVIADMLELGEFSRQEHIKIEGYAVDTGVSIIFTYGRESANIKSQKISVYNFSCKKILHKRLLAELKTGDTVLIKGSRSMKMEDTVEFLTKNYD
ncbi:MAG: UDP-N-acetylmuramoyl-tripeptide--D-alanyl-D-alanine ligase [bacterium]|nr:UDP-N-acetylmuramoyl-tripeptide--D-alanyl-D-alanine ligase [bacterium]